MASSDSDININLPFTRTSLQHIIEIIRIQIKNDVTITEHICMLNK